MNGYFQQILYCDSIYNREFHNFYYRDISLSLSPSKVVLAVYLAIDLTVHFYLYCTLSQKYGKAS